MSLKKDDVERWFFREQRDVQVEIMRLDTESGMELKAQYGHSAYAASITIEIKPEDPAFYAVMTELKIVVTHKGSGEKELHAKIKVTWPFAI